jgi:AcrR family transcriptional regulator
MQERRLEVPKRRFALALAAVEAVIDRALASGKYPPGDTWRECPLTEHLQHAVVNLRKLRSGDSSEPHVEHAATRILMALENHLTRKRQQG